MFRPIFIFLFLITALIRCNLYVSEEQRVFNTIKIGQKAVENENLPKLQGIVSKDYEDGWGHDYKKLMRWFLEYFNQYDNIKLRIIKNSITVHGVTAVCDLNVIMSGNDNNTEEFTASKIRLFISLRKFNKKWLVTHAGESLPRPDQSITNLF
jgi:hypothetical protein